MPPTHWLTPGEDPGFLHGAGAWMLAGSNPDLNSIESQIQEISSRIAATGEQISGLRNIGYDIRVDICGKTETGSRLRLTPTCLQQLSALGIPLSFTVLSEQSAQVDDPLDWLPPADGSHRDER
jgi:hypothetical protein